MKGGIAYLPRFLGVFIKTAKFVKTAKKFTSLEEVKREFLPNSFRREGESKNADEVALGSELIKESEGLIRAALAPR